MSAYRNVLNLSDSKKFLHFLNIKLFSAEKAAKNVYDNEYTLIIDIYFYEFFQPFQTSSTCAPKHVRHPVWQFGKCLRFSLIKIEPVSINPSQAALSLFFFSVVYTFLLKIVLIKN